MPTGRTKNLFYRLALPFLAPSPGRHPLLNTEGGPLQTPAAFERLMRAHHVLGSSAWLEKGDRSLVIYTVSSRPRHVPAPETLYRVASITKMATALAALSCVTEGLLSLDEPVLPRFPAEGRAPELEGVTLRHLLSHTAGLSDPPNLETLLLQKAPFPQALSGCRFAEPGAAFRYSNLGFGLVGCLLEAVLNQPVSRIFEERVFAPLGLNAFLDPSGLDESRIMPITRVLPWHPEKDLTVTPLGRIPLDSPDPLRHYGHTAGSLYIDLPSLRRLLVCLREDGAPLLAPSVGQQMRKIHAKYGSLSPTLSYGLGLLCIQDAALSSSRIWGHQGFAYGCADGAFWEEDTGCLIIFVNGGASEARIGRLGLCNRDVLFWALRKEFPRWT